MSPERSRQRHAMWIRLKELNWMKSHQHLMHGAGNDMIDGEIAWIERELRQKEEQA